MTKQELDKLKSLIEKRFYGPDSDPNGPYEAANRHIAKKLSSEEYNKKANEWGWFCEKLGLKRISPLMAIICNEADSSDIRIQDPVGCVLIFTEEQAKKILVLGL